MKTEHTNRLLQEKSPYLLQHARNPVDWYPWGERSLSLREGAAGEQANLSFIRLLDLPLVPCHEPGVVSERGDCRAPEPLFRPGKTRPRGTAGYRVMDDGTKREIEKVSVRTLCDAGIYEPPVSIKVVLAHLQLNREFFDIQNPTFLDSAKHRVRVHGQKISRLLKKITLVALLYDDEDRIIVDAALPDLKKEFPSFHEVTHRILPWHRTYFHGESFFKRRYLQTLFVEVPARRSGGIIIP